MRKRAQVVIYFDYELQQGADRSTNPGQWEGKEEYENVNKLLEILEKYDAKVCFATVGVIATGDKLPYSSKKQIKKIHSKGHEIASHSFEHYSMTSMRDKALYEDLTKSKEILESTIKHEVITYIPPRNLPFNFFGIAIGLKRKEKKDKKTTRHPFIEKRSLKHFQNIILKAGYKIYREYDLYPKRKTKKTKNLLINKLDLTGFSKKTREYIIKNKNKKEIITCYGHPHALSYKGKQSFEELEKMLKLLKKEKIKTILPREIEKCLEKNGI